MPKSMRQLNCDFLQFTIRFDEKNFNKDVFLRFFKLKKNTKNFTASFGSKNYKKKEHAHFYVSFNGDKSMLLVDFVPDVHGAEEIYEPHIENLHKWLAELFTDKVITDIMVVFKYSNKKYEPEVQLHYPLLLKNKLLEGAEVIGHDIKFPTESFIHKASISGDEKNYLIFLFARFSMNIIDFEYQSAMVAFSKFAEALVKKKEVEK